MDALEPGFCLYDDPDLPQGEDADKWSPLLREAHRCLWSKRLPTVDGERLELGADLVIHSPATVHGTRMSSDTIATTHQRYISIKSPGLWDSLDVASQVRYDRGFYGIGAFIVFPCHSQSLNQRRGTLWQICDRFDLTLECIRLFFEGITDTDRNPLGDVLLADSSFFDLFGTGTLGFQSYVEFFHLRDLVSDGRIRWFDDAPCDEWIFGDSPLPHDEASYVNYLNNVLDFVDRRSTTMAEAVTRSRTHPSDRPRDFD